MHDYDLIAGDLSFFVFFFRFKARISYFTQGGIVLNISDPGKLMQVTGP